jgi:hypothetical protein
MNGMGNHIGEGEKNHSKKRHILKCEEAEVVSSLILVQRRCETVDETQADTI